jgi:hypothetical protein
VALTLPPDERDVLRESHVEDVVDGLASTIYAELAARELEGVELPELIARRLAERFGVIDVEEDDCG